MTESEKRAYRVCFTGYCPEKLVRSEKAIKMDLEREIRQVNEKSELCPFRIKAGQCFQ